VLLSTGDVLPWVRFAEVMDTWAGLIGTFKAQFTG
jgi:hypothetical protein